MRASSRCTVGRAGRSLAEPAWKGASHTLGEELLRPSVIYSPSMTELRRRVDVRAFAHVTGGGISGNLVRVLPDHTHAVVTRGAWEEPPIFAEIQAAGAVSDDEMEQVFNLGVGMLAVVPGAEAFTALDVVRAAGHDAWVIGEVREAHGPPRVTIDC